MAHETPKDPPKGTRRFYFTLTPLALFVLPVRATSCWLVPVSQILKCLRALNPGAHAVGS